MKELDVRYPRGEHSDREEEEGHDAFPDVDHAGRDDRQDDVHPDVGEDGPRGSDEEHVQVLLATHLRARHRRDADGDDHEQVEGRRANDGVRPEVAGFEALRNDLDDREQDLGRRGTCNRTIYASFWNHTRRLAISVSCLVRRVYAPSLYQTAPGLIQSVRSQCPSVYPNSALFFNLHALSKSSVHFRVLCLHEQNNLESSHRRVPGDCHR